MLWRISVRGAEFGFVCTDETKWHLNTATGLFHELCLERYFLFQYRPAEVDVLMEPEEGFPSSNLLLSQVPFFQLSYSAFPCFVCYLHHKAISSPTMDRGCCLWGLLPYRQRQQRVVVSRLNRPGERTQNSVAWTFTLDFPYLLHTSVR